MNRRSQGLSRNLVFGLSFAAIFLLASVSLRANADVLWSQLTGGVFSIGSTEFSADPGFTEYMLDDFVVGGGGWLVNRVTLFGRDRGNIGSNEAVKLAFTDTPIHDTGAPSYDGLEVPAGGSNWNLLFNLTTPVKLAPGTHWLSGWNVRPNFSDGYWLWRPSSPVAGSESLFLEPSGSSGFGTDAVPASTAFGIDPQDLRFLIEGQVVPEPGAIGMSLGCFCAMAIAFRRSRKV